MKKIIEKKKKSVHCFLSSLSKMVDLRDPKEAMVVTQAKQLKGFSLVLPFRWEHKTLKLGSHYFSP